MDSSPTLYDTVMNRLEQAEWRDHRHLQTMCWMIVGLLESALINLPEWATWTHSRAEYAQSTVRRFSRWLHNDRIDVNALYTPIITAALAEFRDETIHLALDTSMLWNRFCLIRVAIVYRGRSIPLVWKVIEHNSAMVAFETYRPLLDQAQKLLPMSCHIVLLADRGFATTQLMEHCTETLKWSWIIRCKGDYLIFRPGKRKSKVGNLKFRRGEARCLHGIRITEKRYGLVHLALAKPPHSREKWYLLSSDPTSDQTFVTYGLRFDIEESFLDDKSNGFQLESSDIRDAKALTRLCFVLAVATLLMVSQGTQVVADGHRRRVDAHWSRGSSYLKIGWRWLLRAIDKGWDIVQHLRLSPLPDPEPCFASKKDREKQPYKFPITYERFGAFTL